MEYRQLGATGITVSAIGFGCNDIGRDLRSPRRSQIETTIGRALDHGITLFDTANSYSSGDSERLLGKALRGRRDRVVLSSKAGHGFWGTLPAQRWLGPVRRHSRWNFLPRFLDMALNGSLRRLGTDYLDVLHLHNPPASVLTDDAVFEALDRLKQQGRIRHYGVSCGRRATSSEAIAALSRDGVGVVQVLASVRDCVVPAAISPTARLRGIGLIGRQPFAHGTVFADPSVHGALKSLSSRTPAQAALRFALDLDGLASVLVGMRTPEHLSENLSAVDSPSLSEVELAALRAATESQ